ncbi:MAG: DotH/IcmK family type IV secretion protein [Alphaproteobacteria bacterium]
MFEHRKKHVTQFRFCIALLIGGSLTAISPVHAQTGSSAIALPQVTTQDQSPASAFPLQVPEPSPGIAVAAPPPPTPSTMPATGALPASSLSSDPVDLAAQAEQAALQAQAQAEADQAKRDQEYNLKSYSRASRGLLPLSPDQIREFMQRMEQTQTAANPPVNGAPKGQVRINTLSLDPGAEPPKLNLAAGYVTTINMVDATGEPWPILDVGVGGSFEVSPTPAGSHVVRVMPLSRVGNGNLSVLLKDLPTPVIFQLAAGGSTVDMRYDARIGKMGPGAKIPLIQRPKLQASSESMMLLLENAPPSGATRMKVRGADERTKAWAMDSRVYVRTPLTLLSPAWDSSVSSADGMTVYDIGDAPVLLMSDNGSMVRAQLMRDDDHDK